MSPPSERAPFDLEAQEREQAARRRRTFEIPAQLEAARARRLEVNFDEPVGIDVGGAVLRASGDVELLPRDTGKAAGHAHADRREVALLGVDRLQHAQLNAITVHGHAALAEDVEHRPRVRLVERALPREIEGPLDADGFDLRALGNADRANGCVVERFDLAVFLRHSQRDLAAGCRRDRQLQMTLIELTADRHNERNRHDVQPLAAQIESCAPSAG